MYEDVEVPDMVVVFVDKDDAWEADVLVGKAPGLVVFVVLLADVPLVVGRAVVLALLLALELVDTDLIQPRS
ncbi:hypothetical protein N0V82_004356 [Gnomoniopsis sp. IMI 355080]|nr:hypothetical protein N0V82_004356 [Gnomoniopsis sp. IMI 355080]